VLANRFRHGFGLSFKLATYADPQPSFSVEFSPKEAPGLFLDSVPCQEVEAKFCGGGFMCANLAAVAVQLSAAI
jgi:hypothetical protein